MEVEGAAKNLSQDVLFLELRIFNLKCINPPVMQSMYLKSPLKSRYQTGETLEYACKTGYTYMWPYYLLTTCEPNGSWSFLEEACLKKACPEPEIENSEIFAPNDSLSFGNAILISCNVGYYLNGKKTLTCNLIGGEVYWDDKYPVCERVLCGRPPKIENGKHTNSYRNIFEYSELVTYSCDPLNGPDQYSLVGESKLICSAHGNWSSDAPKCKVVKCKPPVLEHGKAISEIREVFTYKDVVILECLQGFYLNGSHAVFCGGENTWEPEMPKCIKGYKPTYPKKPPVSNYPGYPNPKELPSLEDFEELDVGSFAVFILTVIVAILLVLTCLYRCLQRRKQQEKEKKEEEEKEKKEKEEKEKKEKEEKEKKEKEEKEKKEKEQKRIEKKKKKSYLLRKTEMLNIKLKF
uniref:Membrane cofactor protein n=1 Tax=Camelus bactrianus TaxID=9837 RepID=A0A9W3GYE1_CAMBA|nr:membrane cofactor protein [Camelus bactrianus]